MKNNRQNSAGMALIVVMIAIAVVAALAAALAVSMKVETKLAVNAENEQQLLRRGLLPPQSLPAAEQARPHYVVGLYQRHGLGAGATA